MGRWGSGWTSVGGEGPPRQAQGVITAGSQVSVRRRLALQKNFECEIGETFCRVVCLVDAQGVIKRSRRLHLKCQYDVGWCFKKK